MSDEQPNRRVRTYPAPEEWPTETICRPLNIPADLRIIAAVSDVLAYLTQDVWESSDDIEGLRVQEALAQMLLDYFQGDCLPDEPELSLLVHPYIGYWWS